jgi:hypothetical protein
MLTASEVPVCSVAWIVPVTTSRTTPTRPLAVFWPTLKPSAMALRTSAAISASIVSSPCSERTTPSRAADPAWPRGVRVAARRGAAALRLREAGATRVLEAAAGGRTAGLRALFVAEARVAMFICS